MMGATPGAGPERGYFDSRFAARIIHVAPGAHEIAADAGEILSTVLGSCVAACIRDSETGEGGMNHFLLPGEGGADLALSGEDLGGDRPRRVNYEPATGRAWVSRLDNPRLKAVLEAESDLRASLHLRSSIPDLEIFR